MPSDRDTEQGEWRYIIEVSIKELSIGSRPGLFIAYRRFGLSYGAPLDLGVWGCHYKYRR